MPRIAKTQPMLDQTVTLQLITAAWQLYRDRGWAERPNRSVVYDPMVSLTEDEDQQLHAGDVIAPALYTTVLDNVLHCQGMTAADPMIPLQINHDICDAAAADRKAVIMDHVMRQLQDDHNDFRSKIVGCLHEPQLRLQDLKILCYITTMADNIRSRAKSDCCMDNARNAVLAPVGHSVDVAVQILSVRFNQEWSTYNHTAITEDGCVVSFFQKTRMEAETCTHITGKVKAHGTCYKRPDLAETRLNYVKIVNDHKG